MVVLLVVVWCCGFLTDNTTMPTKFLYLVDGWVVAIHLGLDAMELC